jgi:glutaminase
MVNAGAIATTSLAPGGTVEARWGFLRDGLSRFAGRALALDEEVHASASATNHRNRGIANLLQDHGRLGCDPTEAVDLYTRQSSLRVSATELAVMGATLAVMTTAGMYETSGDWLYDVGVPGKSGIGGGIVVVSPGKGALGTFAPPLDGFGNSVKGQLAARFLSRRLGLSLFVSEPEA